MVLVDKSAHKLFLAEAEEGKIEIKKSYHVTLGKALGDKIVENDLKTPEGVYFFTTKLTPPSLKKKFGVMALLTNYPNPIDRLEGRTGYDIMLHATDDPSRLKRDYDSEGCVVIDNPEILEISKSVTLGLTPFVIYPELKEQFLESDSNPEVRAAFQSWIDAWRGKDIDSYIGAYDEKFSYNGMNLKSYKQYKNNLNKKYSEIKIDVQKIKYIYHPKYNVVMFTQKYESKLKGGGKGFSSIGTKMVYFVKEGDKYKIASEHYTPTTDI